jgi:AcrR family transcriptional regulator
MSDSQDPHPNRSPRELATEKHILTSASAVLDELGPSAQMADFASAAGVGRATLYRYFDSREALIERLVRDAYSELEAAFDGARLDELDPERALGRLARLLVTVGGRHQFLLAEGNALASVEASARIGEQMYATLHRCRDAGLIRPDLDPEWVIHAFSALIRASMHCNEAGVHGADHAAATALAVFLNGVRPINDHTKDS